METRKPSTQNPPAATIAIRGPTRSTHVPAMAEEMPSMAMAREKIQPTATSPTSKWLWNGALNTLNA